MTALLRTFPALALFALLAIVAGIGVSVAIETAEGLYGAF